MVIVSPLTGVVGPLPNGLFMAYKWGWSQLLTSVLGAHPPSRSIMQDIGGGLEICGAIPRDLWSQNLVNHGSVENGYILKGTDPIGGTHFSLNHDYGRKCNDSQNRHVDGFGRKISSPKNHCNYPAIYRGVWMCFSQGSQISKAPVTWDPMSLRVQQKN